MPLNPATPESAAAEREILELLGIPHDECAILAVVNHNLTAGTVEVLNRKDDLQVSISTTEDQWARIVDIVTTHLAAIADRKPQPEATR